MSYTTRELNGLMYTTADNISARHAFTTRRGGVSEGVYASLNLGANRGDKPEYVRENYKRLGELFGVSEDGFAVTRQVHGDDIRIVTEKDRHRLLEPVPYEADALVTNQAGLPLMVFTADCVPLLMYDHQNNIIAAVHCGWRGTVMDIAGKAVRVMETLGAKAESIRAATGPAIGECCFETGDDVPNAVRELLTCAAAERFIRHASLRADKYYVNLQGVVRATLIRAGLAPENISLSDVCTVCNSETYWSHRRFGDARGSQASIICLG